MNLSELTGLTLEAAREILAGRDIDLVETSPSHQRERLGAWRVLCASASKNCVRLVVAREQLPSRKNHAVS